MLNNQNSTSLFDSDAQQILIAIPARHCQKARKHILKLLHTAHTGLQKSKILAQQRFYWPGMIEDLKKVILSCEACITYLPSQQKQPLVSSSAEYPMQKVGVDLFFYEKDWLVMVDAYSGYPFVKKMSSTTTKAVTDQLTKWQNFSGWVETIRSDGGPAFKSREFEDYCK